MLEGISTPNSAVFIFTSSIELPSLEDVKSPQLRHELQGLLRRFQCVVTIPPLDRSSAESFLEGFLRGYVALPDWEALRTGPAWQAFAAAWRNWDAQVGVPFDMLSKFAEQAVRDFYVDGDWPHGAPPSGHGLAGVPRLVQENSKVQDTFLRTVLDPAAVRAFVKEYAGGAYFDRF
ncbi:unnamed protein product [Polarella glacialis]|uniref:Uncharacterized protein n=1 Tax=Polarella glacialis TaxID=89957 RepID=A0A813I0Q4_POLGL|nr:unnamed protein product [Polarella glacialis]